MRTGGHNTAPVFRVALPSTSRAGAWTTIQGMVQYRSAPEERVVTAEQYAQGYLERDGMVVKKRPYELIRRLPDGTTSSARPSRRRSSQLIRPCTTAMQAWHTGKPWFHGTSV